MRTASLIASLSRKAGGLFESVRRLHQSLAEIPGVEVTVLGLRDEHTAEDLAAWAPVNVFDHAILGPCRFGYSPTLRHRLREMDFDVLHTHGIWMYPSIAARAWSRRHRRPYLVSPHGMLDPWAVHHSAWKKRLARWLYEDGHLSNAACIRALCESEAQAIRAFGLRNDVCVIPNGMDLPEFSEQKAASGIGSPPFAFPDASAHGAQSFGLSAIATSGRKILLYLGRLHPKKGLVNLLRAWAETRKPQLGTPTAGEWVLAVAGWDQSGHESELKQLATELGIRWTDVRDRQSVACDQASLVFLGPQFGEQKTCCYRDCDAFILPSFSEGLPMVILEAWAYSKPVLMTPECNLAEGFTANAGIRIGPNVASIASGLSELFQASPSALCTVGRNGRALVAKRFTWPKIAQEMHEVYEWLLGGRPKPGCVMSS